MTPPTVNSLEWYNLMRYEAKDGEQLSQYESIAHHVHRLPSGRVYRVEDLQDTGNQCRSIQELIALVDLSDT